MDPDPSGLFSSHSVDQTDAISDRGRMCNTLTPSFLIKLKENSRGGYTDILRLRISLRTQKYERCSTFLLSSNWRGDGDLNPNLLFTMSISNKPSDDHLKELCSLCPIRLIRLRATISSGDRRILSPVHRIRILSDGSFNGYIA